ncbi:MAG: hypothetical protein QW614_03360 [Candidatus Caldarchaeum sp.]
MREYSTEVEEQRIKSIWNILCCTGLRPWVLATLLAAADLVFLSFIVYFASL